MNTLETSYGRISGIINECYYRNGQLQECMLDELNQLRLLNRLLIPKYSIWELRDKYINSLSFYSSGKLQSIALAEQTLVESPLGIVPAELITFHENDMINRIFMLNGKISSFWTEDDEYKLAIPLTIKCGLLEITNKFINFCFYPSGNIMSLTIWKKEIIQIQTHHEIVKARIGLSFYENGVIESLEPNAPSLVSTPIGKIEAFDLNALGIFGDANSLKFHKDGSIASLITSTNQITVTQKNNQVQVFKPTLIESQVLLDGWLISPITIDFLADQVIFRDYDGKQYSYGISDICCEIIKT